MKTPINQVIPKIRQKLANCVSNIQRYDDHILSDAIKTVIDMKTLGGNKFTHDDVTISPGIKGNSREEQQLILKTCLLFSLPSKEIEKLDAELDESENGEIKFQGI